MSPSPLVCKARILYGHLTTTRRATEAASLAPELAASTAASSTAAEITTRATATSPAPEVSSSFTWVSSATTATAGVVDLVEAVAA